MPKLHLDTIPQINATGYPPVYADAVQDRWYRRLAPRRASPISARAM